jgi:hypothetical protein
MKLKTKAKLDFFCGGGTLNWLALKITLLIC